MLLCCMMFLDVFECVVWVLLSVMMVCVFVDGVCVVYLFVEMVFYVYMVLGAFAGVVEYTAMFSVDMIKMCL